MPRVKRWLRRSAGFLAGVALLGTIAEIGFRGASEDPLVLLPRREAPVLSDTRMEARVGRLFQHVTLSDARLGSIGFTISLPDPLPSGKLPLVVVLGGLGTGANNIRYIDAAGDNSIIGYDWPLPSPLPKGVQALIDIPALRAQALSMPGQVGAMLSWLSMQPWSDPRRISIIGFSLGAIAAPAAERAAQREGAEVRGTVLAYGGVGLDTLIRGNQRIKPAWIRPLLGAGVALLLRPLEPAEHLPHLTGDFLILSANGDTIIDPQASAGLEQLTPQPKTMIRTDSDHIGTGPDRRRLLQEAMAATRHWLISEGAVDASEP